MPSSYEHCTDCAYSRGKHPSTSEKALRDRRLSMEKGNGADTLLVFQSPGVEEWKRGQPISSENVRSAAAKMTKAFAHASKHRSEFDITNAVQCFSGKMDAHSGKASRDKQPPGKVRNRCAKWLETDLSSRPYKRIVVFGSVAKKTVRKLLGEDPRVVFVPHPNARGVSIECLAAALRSQNGGGQRPTFAAQRAPGTKGLNLLRAGFSAVQGSGGSAEEGVQGMDGRLTQRF